jgi:hypothetical protein
VFLCPFWTLSLTLLITPKPNKGTNYVYGNSIELIDY